MSRLLQGSPKHPRSSLTAAAPPINLGPVFKQGSTEQTGRDGELGLSVTALGTETPWPTLLTHGGKGRGVSLRGVQVLREAQESTGDTSGRLSTVQKAEYCKQGKSAHF